MVRRRKISEDIWTHLVQKDDVETTLISSPEEKKSDNSGLRTSSEPSKGGKPGGDETILSSVVPSRGRVGLVGQLCRFGLWSPTHPIVGGTSIWMKFHARFTGLESLGLPDLAPLFSSELLHREDDATASTKSSDEKESEKNKKSFSEITLTESLARRRTVTLVVRCWNHQMVLRDVPLDATTSDVKKRIRTSMGMEVSPEKQ